MIIQKSIIFRPKKLKQDFTFKSTYPLTEYFFNFKIDDDEFLINTVHVKSENAKGLIFFLHGTLHHIQYHLPKADIFIENNYDVVMMDYPTYGKSKGRLTEQLLHQVVETTFNKTINQLNYSDDVVLVGRSLGTALASSLAAKIHPKHLVLISPYYSMPDLFNHKVKLFSFRKLKFKFENYTYLPNVICNAYILHGNKDKLIPIELSKKLIPLLKDENHFIEIPNADHFNVHEHKIYQEFVKKILS